MNLFAPGVRPFVVQEDATGTTENPVNGVVIISSTTSLLGTKTNRFKKFTSLLLLKVS